MRDCGPAAWRRRMSAGGTGSARPRSTSGSRCSAGLKLAFIEKGGPGWIAAAPLVAILFTLLVAFVYFTSGTEVAAMLFASATLVGAGHAASRSPTTITPVPSDRPVAGAPASYPNSPPLRHRSTGRSSSPASTARWMGICSPPDAFWALRCALWRSGSSHAACSLEERR